MNEQKINEKLAKWRWPDATSIEFEGELPTMIIHLPDQPNLIIKPFTDSVDSSFKWLVPNIDNFSEVQLIKGSTSWGCKIIRKVPYKYNKWWLRGGTPALALAANIEEVIDNEPNSK